jgi:uncharacterized protein (TIGR02594 family)
MRAAWIEALARALAGWRKRRATRRPPAAPAAPAWLVEAERLRGVSEVPGPDSNPTIMDWAGAQGGWVERFYKGDDVPWCGLFVAHCLLRAGIGGPKNPLAALAWADWGRPLGTAAAGAVLVFRRPGGGHVGFCVGEDRDALHVLGGNQSDAVSVVRIARDRLVAIRWPEGVHAPRHASSQAEFTGPLSVDEA